MAAVHVPHLLMSVRTANFHSPATSTCNLSPYARAPHCKGCARPCHIGGALARNVWTASGAVAASSGGDGWIPGLAGGWRQQQLPTPGRWLEAAAAAYISV
jgi:hypothetical protein